MQTHRVHHFLHFHKTSRLFLTSLFISIGLFCISLIISIGLLYISRYLDGILSSHNVARSLLYVSFHFSFHFYRSLLYLSNHFYRARRSVLAQCCYVSFYFYRSLLYLSSCLMLLGLCCMSLFISSVVLCTSLFISVGLFCISLIISTGHDNPSSRNVAAVTMTISKEHAACS